MKSDRQETDFSLDNVFGEKIEYTNYLFDTYKKIYDLKEIEYEGEVSEELFRYIQKRKFFILLVIYDEDGKIFLERNIQEQLYWSLPGGSILKNEEIHAAVRRVAQRICESDKKIIIGEIEPIAFIKNRFFYKSENYTHYGIAFTARIRNKKQINFDNTVGNFVQLTEKELEKINRYANREVARLCFNKIKDYITPFPEIEIATNEKYKTRYVIHNQFMKRFVLTSRRKRKKEFFSLIKSKTVGAKSLIDISCGDNDLIFKLAQEKKFDYMVANDISWSQINAISGANRKILLTNHNAVYLPFRENSFDVAYCGNTFHHMTTKNELLGLLDSLLKIAKKVIILEIEKPSDTGFIPHVLNKFWYRGFLKDVGGAYLSKQEFKTIIGNQYLGKATINFSEFRNIQGCYMLAEIEKKSEDESNNSKSKILEVEKKFFCGNPKDLKKACLNAGFERKYSGDYEKDDYFTDLNGEFIKNRTCLRIRSKNNSLEITFKGKSHSFSNAYAKAEHNISIPMEMYGEYVDILNSLGFFKYVTVGKNREEYSKKEFGITKNIAFDNLDGVGCFVEFEIIDENNSKQIDFLKEILDNFVDDYKKYSLTNADLPYRDYIGNHFLHNVIKKESIKTILFDFDGTIAPSEAIFFNCFKNAAYENFGKQITVEEYKKHELERNGELFDVLKKNHSTEINKSEFMDQVYKDYDKKINTLFTNEKLFVSLEAIKALKCSGYRIGLVTTSKRTFIEKIVNYFKLDDLFDVIVAREDVSLLKPNPECYKKSLSALNISRDECIAVEDSVRGVKSAIGAGIRCISVYDNSLTTRKELEEIGVPVFENLIQISLIIRYAE